MKTIFAIVRKPRLTGILKSKRSKRKKYGCIYVPQELIHARMAVVYPSVLKKLIKDSQKLHAIDRIINKWEIE